jgi:hypothetical protein
MLTHSLHPRFVVAIVGSVASSLILVSFTAPAVIGHVEMLCLATFLGIEGKAICPDSVWTSI